MTTATLPQAFAVSGVQCSRLLLPGCPAQLDTEAGSKVSGFHPLARSEAPRAPLHPRSPSSAHSSIAFLGACLGKHRRQHANPEQKNDNLFLAGLVL